MILVALEQLFCVGGHASGLNSIEELPPSFLQKFIPPPNLIAGLRKVELNGGTSVARRTHEAALAYLDRQMGTLESLMSDEFQLSDTFEKQYQEIQELVADRKVIKNRLLVEINRNDLLSLKERLIVRTQCLHRVYLPSKLHLFRI